MDREETGSNVVAAPVRRSPGRPRKSEHGAKVSDAVQSLRSNQLRNFRNEQRDTQVLSKVRQQVAAIENPTAAQDVPISVRRKIQAFEHPEANLPVAASTPPMTPSRKAAQAARKVTKGQRRTIGEQVDEVPVAEKGAAACTTPRVWPDVRRRKILFESNGEASGQTEASGDEVVVKSAPPTPTRRSQRITSKLASVEAEDASGHIAEAAEKSSHIKGLPVGPDVTYPNPFDEDIPESAAEKEERLFLASPGSARKSKRATRASVAVDKPILDMSTALMSNEPATDGTATDESVDSAIVEKKEAPKIDEEFPTALVAPKTPVKTTMNREQKAAIKTPSKSVARSTRKSRVTFPDEVDEEVPGTPTKAATPEQTVLLNSPRRTTGALTPVRTSARLAAYGVGRSPRMELSVVHSPSSVAAVVDEDEIQDEVEEDEMSEEDDDGVVQEEEEEEEQAITLHEEVHVTETVTIDVVQPPASAAKRKRSVEDEASRDDFEEDLNADLATAAEEPEAIISNPTPKQIRKRRKVLEILPTPVKPTILATTKAIGRRNHDPATTQRAVTDRISVTPSRWTDDEDTMDVGNDTDSDEEGGWLLSVWYKAARSLGLR
ncbi:hypothetical protein HKX48_005521 [Thoreauomyces humboldtii]|nr:hypothetical protein HKX48_005521 [Thoreauomyces humboldtii]